LCRGLETGLVCISHGDHGRIKAVQTSAVEPANEPKANDADANPFVGAKDALRGQCGNDSRALGDAFDEVPSFHRVSCGSHGSSSRRFQKCSICFDGNFGLFNT